ncbi:MAG: DUF3788 family protein [Chloroflexi bacterium]|nr:DUF3788 family protein [Chloroflexota bacterium]
MSGVPFPDAGHAPAHDAFVEAVGPARDRWLRLEAWLRDTYGLDGEPIFFGRDSGWCVRYRRSGKALLTLIPRDDGFRTLAVVGPSAWQAAASAVLSSRTQAAWDGARPYPDGRWLWLDVDDDTTVDDIEELVALKSPPPKHVRVPAHTLRGWTTD